MKIYYTFGKNEHFPFCGGWVEVEAPTIKEAHAVFRANFPDRMPNTLNCADCYTEEQFNRTGMAKTGNQGVFCHKKLSAEKKNEKFFGKECNYTFPSGDWNYSVYFWGSKGLEYKACFDDIDSCILWAAFKVCVEEDVVIECTNAVICDGYGKPVMRFDSQDRLLEYAWQTLKDVSSGEDERIEQNWFIFPSGTFREDIWHWFDVCYSKGVGELMYMKLEDYENELPSEGRKDTVQWLFITEDGKTDEKAEARINVASMLVDINLCWGWDRSRNTAVLLHLMPGAPAMEEITAVLCEDPMFNGYYLLYIYDSEELFFIEDMDAAVDCFCAGNIREAAKIGSEKISDAIHKEEKRIREIRKRYLPVSTKNK